MYWKWYLCFSLLNVIILYFFIKNLSKDFENLYFFLSFLETIAIENEITDHFFLLPHQVDDLLDTALNNETGGFDFILLSESVQPA